jgi:hypothetical protein
VKRIVFLLVAVAAVATVVVSSAPVSIVALHWTRVPSEDNNKVLAGPFPGAQSFVVGSPVNMQVMVKDSKKYAATGGWGFGDFKDGKPGDETLHKACFACHEPVKDRDFVFTHYASF